MNKNKLTQNDLMVAKKLIDKSDFTPIINRLTIIERWSKRDAEEVCKQYRNFLYLNKKYGQQFSLPPSKDIDHAWHAHILYTEFYNDFCNQIFGGYFHHRPHRGFAGAEAAKKIKDDFFNNTQRLYFEEFGAYIYEIRPKISAFLSDLKRLIH